MKQRYMLQSRSLWLTFLLGVVPIVAIVIGVVMAVTAATNLVKPEMIFWDDFGAPGKPPMGGIKIVGWRVGSLRLPSIVMNGMFLIISGFIALVWYKLLWNWGARRDSKRKRLAPITD